MRGNCNTNIYVMVSRSNFRDSKQLLINSLYGSAGFNTASRTNSTLESCQSSKVLPYTFCRESVFKMMLTATNKEVSV